MSDFWLTAFSKGGYFNIIKVAILTFPLLALFITLPYIIYQYRKYGSIYYVRAGIFYSFILYLLVAYFLVILPLPSIESVQYLTTPRVQLIPFHFIYDIVNGTPFVFSKVSTYLKTFTFPSAYVVLYNILLTIPFGIYLRYYFKKNLKQTILYSFLLSLFFEVTQLSGLYFIYPRGYRLFDVDDLILNTLGGTIGYGLGKYFIYILPNRDKIEEDSYRLGLKISFLRRMMALGFDIICFHLFCFLTISIVDYYSVCFLFYFVLFPYACRGKTFGQMFFHIKMVTIDEQPIKLFRLCARQFLMALIYFIFPLIITFILPQSSTSAIVYVISLLAMMLFLYGTSIIYLIKRKPLFHEMITGTTCISTINIPTNFRKEDREK